VSGEAQLQISMRIAKGFLTYQSQPTSFKADVAVAKGQTPGGIVATKAGTDVDLSKLSNPGLCRFQNLDSINTITVGRWDPVTNRFYPMMDLLPGEFYIIRLAKDVTEEYGGTGTGTGAAPTTLRIKATNTPCNVLVEAFES
jgi:hypothetical protein